MQAAFHVIKNLPVPADPAAAAQFKVSKAKVRSFVTKIILKISVNALNAMLLATPHTKYVSHRRSFQCQKFRRSQIYDSGGMGNKIHAGQDTQKAYVQ